MRRCIVNHLDDTKIPRSNEPRLKRGSIALYVDPEEEAGASRAPVQSGREWFKGWSEPNASCWPPLKRAYYSSEQGERILDKLCVSANSTVDTWLPGAAWCVSIFFECTGQTVLQASGN